MYNENRRNKSFFTIVNLIKSWPYLTRCTNQSIFDFHTKWKLEIISHSKSRWLLLSAIACNHAVGFKLACGAHSDIPSVLWSPSAIALFPLFYEVFHCIDCIFVYNSYDSLYFSVYSFYEVFHWWMNEICFKRYIYIYNVWWNLQKLYFINTD